MSSYSVNLGSTPCAFQYDASTGTCPSPAECGSLSAITDAPVPGATPCAPCTGLSDLTSTALSTTTGSIGNTGDLYVAVIYGTAGTTMGPITKIASGGSPWDTASFKLWIDKGGTAQIIISDGRTAFSSLLDLVGGKSMPIGSTPTQAYLAYAYTYSYDYDSSIVTIVFNTLIETILMTEGAGTVTYSGCSAALVTTQYPSGPMTGVQVQVTSDGTYLPGVYYFSYVANGVTTGITANSSDAVNAPQPFDQLLFTGPDFTGVVQNTDIYASNGDGQWFVVAQNVPLAATASNGGAFRIDLGKSPFAGKSTSQPWSPLTPSSSSSSVKMIVATSLAAALVIALALVAAFVISHYLKKSRK